jgi:hypothetical protein
MKKHRWQVLIQEHRRRKVTKPGLRSASLNGPSAIRAG